jgi:hypothetical protein
MRFAHVEAVKSLLIPLELWSKVAKMDQKLFDTYQIQIDLRGRAEVDSVAWEELKTKKERYASEVREELGKLSAFEEMNTGLYCNIDVNQALREYGWF